MTREELSPFLTTLDSSLATGGMMGGGGLGATVGTDDIDFGNDSVANVTEK